MPELWIDTRVSCGDPECAEPQPSAEPESDGDLRYYACLCGYEFGHQKAAPASQDTCAAGVPEHVRRAVSVDPEPGQPVFLGSVGRRP
jgi:hypothetical protein